MGRRGNAGPRARVAPLALAALGAVALAGTPAVLGTVDGGGDPAELAAFEGGSGHAYHAEETVAGAELQEAVLDRCESDPAYRAANWESCPSTAGAPPPSAGAGLRALAAAEPSQVGEWGDAFPVDSLAIHSVVLPTGKVLWFSKVARARGRRARTSTTPRRAPWPRCRSPRSCRTAGCCPPTSGAPARCSSPTAASSWPAGNLSYPWGDGDPQEGRGFRGAAWVFIFDPATETWERLARERRPALGHGPRPLVPDPDDPVRRPRADRGRLGRERPPARRARGGGVHAARRRPGGRDRLETVGSLPSWVNIYPHMFLLPRTTLAGRGAGDRVLMAGPGTGDAYLLHAEDWSWRAARRGPEPRRASGAPR